MNLISQEKLFFFNLSIRFPDIKISIPLVESMKRNFKDKEMETFLMKNLI